MCRGFESLYPYVNEANELRAIINSALNVELEAGIAWTTLYDRVNELGSIVNRIEIQETLDKLPGLRKSMDHLVELDHKLTQLRLLLEDIRMRL